MRAFVSQGSKIMRSTSDYLISRIELSATIESSHVRIQLSFFVAQRMCKKRLF